MSILICIIAVVVLLGVLAYSRAPLWWSSLLLLIGAGYAVLQQGASPILIGILAAVLFIINFKPIRRALVTGPLFTVFRKITPPMSQTEQEAVDAGTVWWDRDLFSGKPDFEKLHQYPAPKLSAEEEAFLNGPTEQLCEMLNDWDITQKRKDLSPEAWDFIKKNGFLGLIIKKEFGGKEFSNYAHARVVTKIATRSGSAAVT
ncbi:MAG: acyl-CoA dehydrogenase family protein, partial [Deefgea sp.]